MNLPYLFYLWGTVAQSVELRTDDSYVLRSNPAGAASEHWQFRLPHTASVFRRRCSKLSVPSIWSMEFNSDKCEVLRITRKRNLVIFPYKPHKKELNVTNAAKYLGVTISKDLNWTPYINNITGKAKNIYQKKYKDQ